MEKDGNKENLVRRAAAEGGEGSSEIPRKRPSYVDLRGSNNIAQKSEKSFVKQKYVVFRKHGFLKFCKVHFRASLV